MMKFQGQIDNLSTGPLLLAWVGMAAAAYLAVALACVLTDTPTLGKMGALWVILAALAGFCGSKFRTRSRTRPRS